MKLDDRNLHSDGTVQAKSGKFSPADEKQNDNWADFAGSLTASVAGAAAFYLANKYKLAPILKVCSAAAAGMVTRPLTKSGVESATLSPQNHTAGWGDFAWGAIDGCTGIFGTAVESKVASKFAQSLGRKYLGSTISNQLAEQAGKRVIENELAYRFASNAMRGASGGMASSAAFSMPHSLYDHSAEISKNPIDGLSNASKQFATETVAGGLLGGAISPFVSAFTGRREIAAKLSDAFQSSNSLTFLRVLHFNDLHSNLVGDHTLSQLGTVVENLRAETPGRSVHLYSLGDEYSGNVVSGFTENGLLENQAIAKLNPTATIPGNHAVDLGGGNSDVKPWLRVVKQLQADSEDGLSKVLAANLEITESGFENFVGKDGLVKPHRIVEVDTPHGGKERVGLIGLVTDEIGDKGVKYKDYADSAKNSITELAKEGVNKIVVLSHLGFSEDVKLAQKVKGIGAIVGGHSHDATPIPQWIAHEETKKMVPIVQAGDSAKWLGDLQLCFNSDGSANRLRSFGRLHPIDSDVLPHTEIEALIESSEMAKQVKALRESPEFSKTILSERFSFGATRTKETALANLVSDAQMSGINEELAKRNEKPIELFLKHTGDIRKGLPSNRPLTGLELGDVFCNGDNPKELCIANMTGRNIRAALEFGVDDLSPAHVQNADPKGNFLQGSGFKYKYDLEKPVSNRISDVEVLNPVTGVFEKLENERVYKIGTLMHPIDKWAKNGVFKTEGVYDKKAAHEYVQSQIVGLSQPRLLDKYIGLPSTVKNAMLVGFRFQDITTKPWVPRPNPIAVPSVIQYVFNGRSTDVNERASF